MLLKQRDILIGWDEDVIATKYVNANGGIMNGCLGDIDNFLNSGKLDQVVAIVKSCSPNVIGNLTVTIKDLSGIIPSTIHYKVIDEGRYGKDITVGASLILANVSVFSLRPLVHYLNITMINVVKVFRKDTVHVTGTGTDIQEKDEKQSQNDKTGLGMEKTVKDKAKSKPESQSSQKVNRKVNWSKSKSTQVNPEAKVTEI
ncbi:GPCR kinase [Tanacetum coccineum]